MNLTNQWWDHRKTLTVIERLGLGTEALPLRLWAYVSTHHGADGRLSGYTANQIERIVGWRSTPGKFVAAMEEIGWLEPLADGKAGWECHQWTQHQPRLYTEAECLERVERARVEWAAMVTAEREAAARRAEEERAEIGRRNRENARKRWHAPADATAHAVADAPADAAAPSNSRTVEFGKNDSLNGRMSRKSSTAGGAATEQPASGGAIDGDGEIDKGALKDGQSPEFAPASGGGNEGGEQARPGYWKGLKPGMAPPERDWRAWEHELGITGPNENTEEVFALAIGKVRGLLQTSRDIAKGKAYCAELDEKHGGCWGAYAKRDAGALWCACEELFEAIEKRKEIKSRPKLLNVLFHKHRNRRLKGVGR